MIAGTFMLVCATIAGGAIGWHFCMRLAQRTKFFVQLDRLLVRLRAGIGFWQESLSSILGQFAGSIGDCPLSVFLDGFVGGLGGEPGSPPSFLTEEERGMVVEFFSSLGRSDSQTELERIESFAVWVEGKRRLAESTQKKYGSTILKLSTLGGLLVGILLI